MPASLYLDAFGSVVWDAFGQPPYLVGSALPSANKADWRDVDVRLIMSDEQYESFGLGHPERSHRNARWVALAMAFSALGKQMTGLPIDFQIQQQTDANKTFEHSPRSALGCTAARLRDG